MTPASPSSRLARASIYSHLLSFSAHLVPNHKGTRMHNLDWLLSHHHHKIFSPPLPRENSEVSFVPCPTDSLGRWHLHPHHRLSEYHHRPLFRYPWARIPHLPLPIASPSKESAHSPPFSHSPTPQHRSSPPNLTPVNVPPHQTLRDKYPCTRAFFACRLCKLHALRGGLQRLPISSLHFPP